MDAILHNRCVAESMENGPLKLAVVEYEQLALGRGDVVAVLHHQRPYREHFQPV